MKLIWEIDREHFIRTVISENDELYELWNMISYINNSNIPNGRKRLYYLDLKKWWDGEQLPDFVPSWRFIPI